MNSSLLFKVLILCIGLRLATSNLEYDLRRRFLRGIRNSPLAKDNQKPIKRLLERVRQKYMVGEHEPAGLHGLAKTIEVILSRIIPNHNLVQDLMGYVTMPRPQREFALRM